MSSSPLTSTATVRFPSEAALATFISCATLVSRSFLAWSSRICWSTRSSAVETSRPTLRRASSRPSDGVIRSSVRKSMVPSTRLPCTIGKQTPDFSPLRRADRGPRAGLHLAQVGDEHQVARLPRLAVEPLPFAEPRLGGHPPEFLAHRARVLDERQRLVVGMDLPERAVRPPERLAHARQRRRDHVADRPGPRQAQQQLIDRGGVGRDLGLPLLRLVLSRSRAPR